MPITYDVVRQVARDLYGWSLKKVPDDTLAALAEARQRETNPTSQRTLDFMQAAARAAEREDRHACSDAGFPTYFVKIGTRLTLDGDIRRAFVDGFADLVETIQPPILKFITHPLTLERSYTGKDMPIVSFDVADGADYMDITCSPKALGSGRWADLKIFSYPKLADIEGYVMECVMEAGSQHCPPVVIGVGIGGSFDNAAKLAKWPRCARSAPRMTTRWSPTWRNGCSPRSTRPASARWERAAIPPRWRSMSTIRTAMASCPSPSASTAGSTAAPPRAFTTTGRWCALSDVTPAALPRLKLPLSPDEARALKLGDTVILDGEVTVTAGFPTHQRMAAALDQGEALPFPMQASAFFHMGSSCRAEGDRWVTNYVNPTTSTRFDDYMPGIIRRLGLTATGGKGGMGRGCVEALRDVGGVYFSMPGGASPLLSIGAVERLATGWDDLIEQFRLSRFRLEGFGPVTVAIDAHGNSMYDDLQEQASARMPRILEELEQARQDSASRRATPSGD